MFSRKLKIINSMGGMIRHAIFKKGSDKIPTSEIPSNLWEIGINDLEGNPTKLSNFTKDKKAFIFVNLACK
jgi:hypothetical protein